MKKIYTIFTMLVMILSITALTGTAKELKNADAFRRPKLSRQLESKLDGMLKEALFTYRSKAKLEKASPTAKRRFYADSAPVITDGRKRVTVADSSGISPNLAGILLDDAVQARWKNPDFDVLRVLIKFTGNVHQFDGINLKIRHIARVDGLKLATVEIASTELERVARIAGVSRISPIQVNTLANDRGAFNTGVSALRRKQDGKWTKGYTGEGIVVGVVDSGIDWTHGDFINPDGSTRILYYWDTSVDTPGQTPADLLGGELDGLDYGTLWTKADIDAGMCTSTDTNGHGTHVAGTAAGNGYATGKYTGMAPNADIVFTQGLDDLGVLLTYEISKRLNKPCVVNMSYVGAYPRHFLPLFPDSYPADNTGEKALFFKALQEQYGAGHIPVAACGNNGEWGSYDNKTDFPLAPGGSHAGARLTETVTHNLLAPDYGQVWADNGWGTPNDEFFPMITMGMWYDSPVQITLTSPTGSTFGPLVHGSSGMTVDSVNPDCMLIYEMAFDRADNGSYYAVFRLMDFSENRLYPTPGNWRVKVEPIGEGSGYADLWVGELAIFNNRLSLLSRSNLYARFTGGDNHSNYIVDKDASDYVVSVANWVSQVEWTSIDGGVYSSLQNPRQGEIAPSSAPGPTRDRRVKPDIAAPGSLIMSSASKDAARWDNDVLMDPDGQHGIMTGTSMASPHVAGGIALILQKHPHYNMRQVVETIKSYARTDRYTRSYGANAFGYGKFNVKPLNDPPVAVVSAQNNGNLIAFDGSASYDTEDFKLTYEFTFEALAVDGTSSVNFNQSQEKSIGYIQPDPTVDAYYRVKMRVNDGIVNSSWVYSDWVLIQH